MAWWTLKNISSGGAELVIEMVKDDKRLFINEGYDWGEIQIETEDDEPPAIDLQNPDGFNILGFDCENWEGGNYRDQGSSSVNSPDDLPDDELDSLGEAYNEDWIPGLEKLGWVDIGEQQWWLYGPLQLEDEDGNIIASGDPESD
jgi:hypothetical protein